MATKARKTTNTVELNGPEALLAARFDKSVVLVNPTQTELVASCIKHVATMALEHPSLMVSDSDDFWPEPGSYEANFKPYVVKEGVLNIPVKGVLLNNFDYAIGSYATGYQYIEEAFNRGEKDPSVKGMVLAIDSSGGQAAGNFELVEHLGTGTKPLLSAVSGVAYSGGYSIATAGDEIVVAKSGGVGSIGVVTSHVDISKALDKQGVAVTLIFAGAHKVDGNPFNPLPKDVKDRIQASVDETYGIFCSTVAKNRDMEDQAVRDTEADTFSATEGVENGLVDKIGSFKETIATYRATVNGEHAMANISQEDHDKALKDAREAGAKDAQTSAATAERKRIQAILGCDEAKDKQKLANELAYGDEVISLATCQRLLKAAPAETTATATTEDDKQAKANQDAFDKTVGAHAPNIAPGKGKEEQQETKTPQDTAKSIISSYKQHGGGATLKPERKED